LLAREVQGNAVLQSENTQAEADRWRKPAPPTDEAPDGAATIETFTILHENDGGPVQGVVIARMDSGARTLARIPAAHADEIAFLKSPDRYPIGSRGRVTTGADGIPDWRTVG